MAASSDDRSNERSGGGDHEEEERTDGWMATYADMVTLLMTFFVLMFALSNADAEKATLFMAAMSREGLSFEQFEQIRDRFEPSDFDDDYEWFLPPAPGDEDEGEGEDEEEGPGYAALEALAAAIRLHISEEGLEERLGLEFDGEYLRLTITDQIWFESARVEMTPEMYELADQIADLLTDVYDPNDPFEITVAGHTDNVPINTPRFPSNWHVSRDRAFNFLWALYNRSELPPGLFSARAYGEYHPVNPDRDQDSPEERQRNRRVEVLISLARRNPLWEADLYYD